MREVKRSEVKGGKQFRYIENGMVKVGVALEASFQNQALKKKLHRTDARWHVDPYGWLTWMDKDSKVSYDH
jgi:hypothetical protein